MSTPSLFTEFDQARDRAYHDKLRQEQYDKTQQEIKVLDGQLAPEDAYYRVDTAKIQTLKTDEKKKREDEHYYYLLVLQLQNYLRAMEADLSEKYGENFAEELAAELLSEEQYSELMKIEDKEERRRAIAEEINDGIRDGTIAPEEAYENPDFKEWLDKNREFQEAEAKVQLKESMSITLDEDKASYAETKQDNNLSSELNDFFSTPS